MAPPVSDREANVRCVLTIAGSDSSGGAGIQADLKTIIALGCYGASAITALTAQNTVGVQGVHPCPPDFVEQQITSVVSDLEIYAMKTGMLYDAANAKAVVKALRDHYKGSSLPPLVCDPVCVSTSGHRLLHSEAIQVLFEELFPISSLITPNKAEAKLLLASKDITTSIESLQDMLLAAESLLHFGPRAVLLKGGHITASHDDVLQFSAKHPEINVVRHALLEDNMEILLVAYGAEEDKYNPALVVDILRRQDGRTTLFVRPRINSKNTHGTGCTLSAAISCGLAQGYDLEQAVKNGVLYTYHGIETAYTMGKGHGPLNHGNAIVRRMLPLRTAFDPFPLTKYFIQNSTEIWKAYVQHDFVKLLAKGTLPPENFIFFIKQDYHYLKYYARAYALLAAKSATFEQIASATQTILNILQEIGTHRSFCETFGVSREELENTPESPATTAYGAYLIDVGVQGDATKLLMAVLACLLGYGEVGLWLKKEYKQKNTWVIWEGNPYQRWIEDYSGERYQGAVKLGLEVIEGRATVDPPSPLRLEEWKEVWERCARFEKGFWDAAMEMR